MIDVNNFSVVLLSAGIGRRLGKIGTAKPKCLLEVNKKKLIEIIIEILQKRNVREISIIVGYKAQMIKDAVKKFSKIKFNFIKINNYKVNGHACSWYAFRQIWSKKKLPILLFHTDIFFDPKYLDNIIKSKKTNIIGIHSNKNIFKEKSILIKTNKHLLIKEINYKNEIKNSIGEVIGINKISRKTANNLFLFMKKFLIKKNKRLSWEFMLDNYLKNNNDLFFVLQNQNFFWTNINHEKDYLLVKNI
jgi:choline kinase